MVEIILRFFIFFPKFPLFSDFCDLLPNYATQAGERSQRLPSWRSALRCPTYSPCTRHTPPRRIRPSRRPTCPLLAPSNISIWFSPISAGFRPIHLGLSQAVAPLTASAGCMAQFFHQTRQTPPRCTHRRRVTPRYVFLDTLPRIVGFRRRKGLRKRQIRV